MPGPQVELAADQVQLVALGVGEAVVRRRSLRPVPARVGHLRVEQELVELVGQVVVVGDRGPVAAAGVQPAGQPGLRRGRPRARADRAEPQAAQPRRRRARSAGPAGSAADGPAPPASVQNRDRPVGDVALDVQLAGDERPGQAQLARVPQQPAQRPPVPDDRRPGRRVGRRRPRCRPRRAGAPAAGAPSSPRPGRRAARRDVGSACSWSALPGRKDAAALQRELVARRGSRRGSPASQ